MSTATPLASQQLNAVEQALRGGDVATALKLARALIATHPRSADARFALAVALLESGDEATSWSELEAVLARAPDHLAALVHKAHFLRQRGFAHQGMDVALRATQAHPAAAAAWVALGWCALDAHRTPGALYAFGEATRLTPNDPPALAALARAQAQGSDFEAAESGLRSALKMPACDPGIALELTMRLRQQGRSQEALVLLDALDPVLRDSPAALELRVGALSDLDRTPEALEQARELASAHPDSLPALQLLAQQEWEYGDGLDAANEVWARRVRSRPDDIASLFARLGFLQTSRQHQAALEMIESVQHDHAGNIDLDLQRACSLDETGDHATAGELYARMEARHGGRVAFFNQWTRNRLRARDAVTAEQLAQRAIGLDPANQEAMAYLGTAWRLQDDPREFQLCDFDHHVHALDVAARNPLIFTRLRDALEDLHRARREPLQQSVRGGQQTTGRLFASHRAPAIRGLQPLLVAIAQEWLATLAPDGAHPFLHRNTGKIAMTGSWSVRLASGGNHVNHIHNEGWISSALYVSLPPCMQHAEDSSHAGWLQFGQPPAELGLDLPPRRVIRPEVGKLVLFPSFLWHGTVPFVDDQPRLTIAFDMVPRAS